MNRLDLVGKKYNRLTVVEFDSISNERTYWKCQCDCGNTTIVMGYHIKSGKIKSCGCLNLERIKTMGKKHKEYNDYYIEDDYVFVKIRNSCDDMICDKSDWNLKTNQIKWYKDTKGYIRGVLVGIKKSMVFHRVIFENIEYNQFIDHINGNKLDNRRCNLRIVTREQNAQNRKLHSNNTSGITGISWRKRDKKWVASIQSGRKRVCLGYFKNIDDAINTRIKAEIEMFGEYRRINYNKGDIECTKE